MVIVKKSKPEELEEFFKINTQNHIENHLNIKSLAMHQKEFKNGNNVFLSIFLSSGKLAGYITLVKGNHINTIQFKRIAINESFLGIGQKAIIAMENYCTNAFTLNRIWLDVYKNNSKAIHIYKKLGYKIFKQGEECSRDVLFFEKIL